MPRPPQTPKKRPHSAKASTPLPSVGKIKDTPKAASTEAERAYQGRGRPSSFTEAHREQALAEYLAGDSTTEIAQRLGCSTRTVRGWIKAGDWGAELRARRETSAGLEAQILRLSRVQNPTTAQAHRLAMLTRSLERLRRAAPTPKPRPIVQQAVSAETLARALDPEYGLYAYQVEFLKAEERFRIVLKARQIGFSYVVGLAVLLGALAGRPQIVVSASERQAQIILNYVRVHAAKLEVALDEDTAKAIKVKGTDIIAVSTNFRTAQGFAGDVWLDEFAWVRNQKLLYAAVIPAITAIGGRVTIFSTPFLPGSLFWEIATNHQGKYSQWRPWTVTIEDAIAQGMPLPGGIDELRSLFDSESWAMFYECQWAENGAALLSWDLLHSLTDPSLNPSRFGRLQGGVDVGRINDRTAIALIGQGAQGRKWGDRLALVHHELHKNMAFAAQKSAVLDVDQRFDVEAWRIDKTGLGMQLAEDLQAAHPERFEGVWFSAQRKARLALNLLKLCEDRRLILPNDPGVLAQLHAVQKQVSGESIRYDADRTEDGHADLFWAVALAADGRAARGTGGVSVEVLT